MKNRQDIIAVLNEESFLKHTYKQKKVYMLMFKVVKSVGN